MLERFKSNLIWDDLLSHVPIASSKAQGGFGSISEGPLPTVPTQCLRILGTSCCAVHRLHFCQEAQGGLRQTLVHPCALSALVRPRKTCLVAQKIGWFWYNSYYYTWCIFKRKQLTVNKKKELQEPDLFTRVPPKTPHSPHAVPARSVETPAGFPWASEPTP